MKFYFLTMQLSAVFLLAALSVSATTSAQSTVSFTGKDAPLEQVFAAVRKQTGYTFVYYTEALQGAHKVTIDVKGMTVEEFLGVCLKDQPLTWKVIGQTVMIAKKEAKSITVETEEPPVSEIKGKITNDKGEPLAGASVTVKGTKRGSVTAADGTFDLKNVEPGKILIISYAGFSTREITIGNSTVIELALQPANSHLDEVQVIAYGQTTERLNVGNITTVGSAEIEKQPVDNPLLTLEGRVPGLVVTQSTGLPGTGVTVLVQGQNSLDKGNDPFYVIDGVPYTSQLLPNLGGMQGGSGVNIANSGNPLNYINPSDIESITVLKDADATAIYGSRAANGAILITTKKGKAGQTRFDFNLQSGVGKVPHKVDLLNLQEYREMRHEAIMNDGNTIQPTDYDINGFWDSTRSTDWQKALIGKASEFTNLNGTVSGGNTNTQYLVGATYNKQTTVFPGNLGDEKGSVHFSINNSSADQKFKLQFGGNYQIDKNKLPFFDLTQEALLIPPDAPKLYNADGTINWALDQNGISSWSVSPGQPMAALMNVYTSQTTNLISNALLSYEILRGLTLQSSFGYTNMQVNETQIFPLAAVAPAQLPYSTRTAEYTDNNINSWIIEPQLKYKVSLGAGKLDALLGTTIEQNNSNGQILNASGFNSDAVMGDIQSASSITVSSTDVAVYKYNALFARINYNLDEKYLVDITARRDGSSRFGSADDLHNFGAAGLGWLFSNERFVKENLAFVSFGKLKFSYGTTGNDQIGDYQYLDLYSPTYAGVPYQGVTGLAPVSLPNPYIEWEETRKINIGADLGFIKDRIILNVNAYRNRSSNQLTSQALPIITGFNGVTENFPATVQNSGVELSLRTINIKRKNFQWTTNLNLTIPKNKLVSYKNIASSGDAYAYVVGKPVTITRLFHLIGVDPATGVYEFATSKGSPTTTPDYFTDANIYDNTAATLYGGLENSIQYKGFNLDLLFQGVKQLGQTYAYGDYPGYLYNQPATVLQRWQKPGDLAPIQRYNADFSLSGPFSIASTASDGAYRDASFVRLKNVSLSWQFPGDWQKKRFLHSARIYIQGQNVLTFTKYIGLDPGTKSNTTLPPLRVIAAGIQVSL